ncbi:MAG: helix-turn-helix domain-containing protein [Treponema sp.]|jgi:transcriptional regulator with XRE-family HTH domain|nr:helix-turn-helix domain-containing protein [Treponema sp.]
MGFKENLKAELAYKGMLVKELSALSGIKKHTIDNYLNTHNSIPSAEAAVRIARVLGVSVEYLITGKDAETEKQRPSPAPNLRLLLQTAEGLDEKYRKIALVLLRALKKEQDGSGK